MKRAIRLVVSILLLGSAFAAGTWYQHRSAQARGGASDRKVLYYVDPMHPAYRSDKPGIAPDCGMQLEPVYADGGPAEAVAGGSPRPVGAVRVSPEQQQLLGVRVGVVEKGATTQAVRLFGRVTPDESRVYTLNAALEGSIREVSAVTTGSQVRKDQWLASFFSYDARTPLQAYITALDVQDLDPAGLKRVDVRIAAGATAATSAEFSLERLRSFGMSTRQIAEVKRTRRIPLTIGIHAPADGFVIARNVSLGQKFDRGAEWYRIANLDKVWIVADVLADEAAHLRPGSRALVTIPNQPTKLTAVASEVLPQFDPATRTLKVRLVADNPGFALRPDMFVDVEFPVERPAAVTIPVDALIDSGLRRTVFVERGPGQLEPRAVETGWRSGDRVEVVSGLEPGERIVTSGTFLVDSESRLKAAAAGVHGAASTDPVCGMEVDEAKAKAAGKTLQHGGKTYFFCSEQCMGKFQGEHHEHAHHEHGTLSANVGEAR